MEPHRAGAAGTDLHHVWWAGAPRRQFLILLVNRNRNLFGRARERLRLRAGLKLRKRGEQVVPLRLARPASRAIVPAWSVISSKNRAGALVRALAKLERPRRSFRRGPHFQTATSRARMPGLPAVENGNANGFRRRLTSRQSHFRRRTAGQRRRPRRQTVRWPGGQVARQSTRRSRNQSRRSLRHECRETLQVGAERQTTHSQETERARDCRVPSVAGCRTRFIETTGHRLPRRHGRAVADRQGFQSEPAPW